MTKAAKEIEAHQDKMVPRVLKDHQGTKAQGDQKVLRVMKDLKDPEVKLGRLALEDPKVRRDQLEQWDLEAIREAKVHKGIKENQELMGS